MTIQHAPRPRTVTELYPSPWLGPGDLAGRAVTVTIARVDIEDIRNPQTAEKEPRAVVTFERAQKRLIVNKTQAHRLAEIAGTEAFEAWPGLRVILHPGLAPNKREPIVIDPAPVAMRAPSPPAQPAPMPPGAEEGEL